MKLALTLAALAFSVNAAAVTPAMPDGGPFQLANTAVHSLHAKDLNRDYQIYVAPPADYDPKGPRLPVVFVTDADYAFPLLHAIRGRVQRHSDAIAPFIIVGLSYGVGDSGMYSRRRDYTPTVPHDGEYKSDMPGRPVRFGEAEGYRRFLAEQVLPLLNARYRIDMSRSMLVGHSYGGLLGVHTLLTTPDLFSHYVISSPSLWFDDRLFFKREQAYAARHRELKANVFFAVGEYETYRKGDARFSKDKDEHMVEDMRDFNRQLLSHHYAGLRTQAHVLAGHDHLTGFPDMITQALKWAFPGK